MTTYDLNDVIVARPAMPSIVGGLKQVLAALLLAHRRRQTVLRLARLDAVQLADIGLEPTDIEDARNGDGRMLWLKLDRRG